MMGTAELLLATNNALPDGARIIAEGVVPVATPPPAAESLPVLRSMLNAEMDESP